MLDTIGDLAGSINYVLGKHSYPEISLDDTKRFIGNGIARLMELALPGGMDNPLFEKCLEEFSRHYTDNMENLTQPYPGIMELLDELSKRKYKIAIVSNKFDTAVKALNKKYFSKYISIAIGESKNIKRKPAPDTVYKALEELGVKSENAIYVGDSEVDILTARNAGLTCVSVSWGFRDRELLENHRAEYIIDKPSELLTLFDK